MLNRRGQMWSLWLVFVVLAMMALVLTVFSVHQEKITASVVSPMEVLKIRDSLEIFEGQEEYLIEQSLKSANGNFGSQNFFDSFYQNFINGVDEEMQEFIFEDLTFEGVEVKDENKNLNLIENGIYTKSISSYNENQIIFVRNKIGKSYVLETNDESEINFPMRFNFEFEKKYLITYENLEYIVEDLN